MAIKYMDEYRDAAISQKLVGKIKDISKKNIRLMEVCGTHTVSIFRSGIRSVLPRTITLLSGPGCPVCVTAQKEIDAFIELAKIDDVIVCTFGDLMRVPSSTVSLEHARAEGAKVEVVYSPRDALDMARAYPEQQVIFLAVGFETTVPTIAGALAEAEADGVPNFLLLPGNKTMPQVMRVLVDDPELDVDGFLLPGHVSVITGWQLFGAYK